MATSTHNKYVSIPDWFSSSSSTPITSTEKPANITNVYYGGGGGGGTTGITEIPIDNKTIVWLDLVITVPIDNDKIIINTEGKITTSGTTGVWELRQLTDGTNYIYTTYPVVTQLGITMYAGTDGLDLGSIYDGLPIDNTTIYWDLDENGNKILKAVGSSGGVADSVAWANVTGKPDWLLDGKILYTEIEGIPDLSGFITKDYIDGKFVTFDLNETIDGIKTFTNGIKIGTSLINQSLNDVIYVDANLVVRGGITMYATGTVDIPSILDSLPVAGTESKGIASFDSSYFSVTNGKVTLLTDNVGLNESELAEYLNTNNYAKKSDIPSLNGYATQSWVESKGYALNSDLMLLTTKVDDFLEGSDTDTIINKWLELEAFLSGLSESDNLATILGTKADKTYVDETFVTIGGNTEQVITGAKNFTGGIKINGSPIYYDTEKKYWKLEGDLLVTGGVTMYGNEGTYTPSTIMDAIAVDGTTISKSGGVLKVIGGTGGGVADSVAWANITGKPTWIGSSKPTYSYSEITGAISTTELQNYLTSNSYLNVTGGDNRYLKLSGGQINSENDAVPLSLNNTAGTIRIAFSKNNNRLGYLGFKEVNPVYISNGGDEYEILHSGNYSQYALPLSGGTITGTLEIKCGADNKIVINNTDGEGYSRIVFQENGSYIGQLLSTKDGNIHWGGSKIWHSGNFTPSNYLPLSGGTLSGNLTIQNKTVDVITLYRDDVNNSPSIKCANKSDGTLGYIGVLGSGSGIGIQPFFMDSAGTVNKIWCSGNDGSGSGLDADLLDGLEGSWYIHNVLTFQSNNGTSGYGGKDLNSLTYGLVSNYGSYDYWANAPTGMTYGMVLNLKSSYSNDLMGQLAWDINHHGADSTRYLYWRANDNRNFAAAKWHQIAFTDSNVASATKLQTAKTIWGQSFDGTGNVDGKIILTSWDNDGVGLRFQNSTKGVAYVSMYAANGNAYLFGQNGNRFLINHNVYGDIFNVLDGNVGVGTPTPTYTLDVNGSQRVYSSAQTVYKAFVISQDVYGSSGYYSSDIRFEGRVSDRGGVIRCALEGSYATFDSFSFYSANVNNYSLLAKLDASGNILTTGGITMYSDQRKKTILNHVELSLKDIANAPLIEHYYNSDESKTTHVGSIAQYWASMNDWFCKLDSEGYYTMEIQNAALASAISIARELDRYESKTDKAIKKLKKRICKLEEEVERLKSA